MEGSAGAHQRVASVLRSGWARAVGSEHHVACYMCGPSRHTHTRGPREASDAAGPGPVGSQACACTVNVRVDVPVPRTLCSSDLRATAPVVAVQRTALVPR